MKPEIKALWLNELRNGDRQQGNGRLRDDEGRECCLGVLSDLAAQAGVGRWQDKGDGPIFVSTHDAEDWSKGVLPESVAEWAGLPGWITDPEVRDVDSLSTDGPTMRLSYLNDTGVTFAVIADLIERDL